MKAAVVFKKGELPQFANDFPEPVVSGDDELLMSVKAASIKHLDRMRAGGTHYSAQGADGKPFVPGLDGVGILPDGRRVYAVGITGTMAEKAIVKKMQVVDVPHDLDDATAAALPNAVMGSALALRFRAMMQPGATVVINGATGVTGKTAVQVARLWGAGKVIVTGRNQHTLETLLTRGADQVVSLSQNDNEVLAQLQAIHHETPIDIVIDYLWGHSAELLLEVLKGNGAYTRCVRYITVGAMTGDKIALSSGILRSTDLQIIGSGLGSLTPGQMREFNTDILPRMFGLAAEGKLLIDTATTRLQDIQNVWERDEPGGKRTVVLM